MKLQYQKLTEAEYLATYQKLNDALRASFGSDYFRNPSNGIIDPIHAFDSDFQHTTNLSDARWLFVKHFTIVKIGNDGTMIHLTSA